MEERYFEEEGKACNCEGACNRPAEAENCVEVSPEDVLKNKLGNDLPELDEESEEFQKLREEWFAKAAEQTLETLPEFINNLMLNYIHDYGTIVHAMMAAMMGTFRACDESPNGGLTGMQVAFLVSGLIRKLGLPNNQCGFRVLDYDGMLYPQYADKFQKIEQRTWDRLQAEAKKLLEEEDGAHEVVRQHWQSIVDGVVPFGYSVVKEDD